MAEDRAGSRDYPAWKPKPASWTKIFGTFLVALDPFKLAVAACGILATAIGWWLLSIIFYSAWSTPQHSYYEGRAPKDLDEPGRIAWADREYNRALGTWALMYELAGPSDRSSPDYAQYYQRKHPDPATRNPHLAEGYGGKFRAMPWMENRGPNPFLTARTMVSGSGTERRDVLVNFGAYQVPNLVEPLLRYLTPVYFLLDPRSNFWVYLYLILLILWMLVVWGFFGGVITRMAVLQLTSKEGGGLRESVAFVRRRYLSYLLSPIVPLILIAFLVLCCILFGVIHWVPGLGDFFDGIFWFLPLLAGLVMTLLLVGMVGYPMMYTTLSTEGSDTFDALSRSYNYVYESPWHYLWYAIVAIFYGAALTLFVVVVGSATVYLSKWGVKQFPAWWSDRSPEYLFVFSPESLGWRQLLTEGSPAAVDSFGRPIDSQAYDRYLNDYAWYNFAGAGMVSFWVTIVFMLVIGFSYSYFWTVSTQVYLLMRKRVDETEMDEVYVEEEPAEAPMMPEPMAPLSPAAPTPTGPVSVPVEAPTLKKPETTSPPAPENPADGQPAS